MKVTPKGNVFDCIYYRGDNYLDVIRFCGGKASMPSTYISALQIPICIKSESGICYTAPVGSYIVKEGNALVVYDEITFEQKFDLYQGGSN